MAGPHTGLACHARMHARAPASPSTVRLCCSGRHYTRMAAALAPWRNRGPFLKGSSVGCGRQHGAAWLPVRLCAFAPWWRTYACTHVRMRTHTYACTRGFQVTCSLAHLREALARVSQQQAHLSGPIACDWCGLQVRGHTRSWRAKCARGCHHAGSVHDDCGLGHRCWPLCACAHRLTLPAMPGPDAARLPPAPTALPHLPRQPSAAVQGAVAGWRGGSPASQDRHYNAHNQ